MAKRFKCPKCDRAFSMAAHLARHMNTIHGSRGAKAAAKRGKRRKVKARGAKRIGRPAGVTSRLGLRRMTLDQLAEVIDAARAEGRRKIRDMQAAF